MNNNIIMIQYDVEIPIKLMLIAVTAGVAIIKYFIGFLSAANPINGVAIEGMRLAISKILAADNVNPNFAINKGRIGAKNAG